MPLDTLLALVAFAAVMAGTPGPNNVMVLASGLNFGFRRTLPHMLGIAMGFGAMNTVVGLGLGTVLTRFPVIFVVLKVIGALYLLSLAYAIATSGPVEDGTTRGKPLTFLEGAAFQWVNPKAWIIAVGAIAAYAQEEAFTLSVIIIGVVMAAVTMPCVAVWTGFGHGLRAVLSDARRVRLFNYTMAALLLASLWPALTDLLALLRAK